MEHWKVVFRLDTIQGWRATILAGAALSFAAFLLNMTLAIVASQNHLAEGDQRTIFQGSCSTAKNRNIAFHSVINIISTVILGASNYAMQCLSAPTRSDLDAAHARRRWMDIGILSLRNLTQISRKRVVVWALLGFSSLPLHFFYNSVVTASLTSRGYYVFTATESGLQSNSTLHFKTNSSDSTSAANQLLSRARAQGLQRLDPQACIKAYATNLQSRYGHVILVQQNLVPDDDMELLAVTETIFTAPTSSDTLLSSYEWICAQQEADRYSGPCPQRLSLAAQKGQDWRPNTKDNVAYCLSEEVPERCRLQMSITLIAVVIVFNFTKFLVLIHVFWTSKHQEPPILTIGDAVQSYLQRPDETTLAFPLMEKADASSWKQMRENQYASIERPRKRYFEAVSPARWLLGLSLYSITFGVSVLLLALGLMANQSSSYASYLFSLPLAAITPEVVLGYTSRPSPMDLIQNVMLVNLPQLALSAVYYTYNGIFTNFLLARELNQYASKREGLRVSSAPMGDQRSSYFLQLPYRVGLPIIAASALLHWLCSQSLFLVNIDYSRAAAAGAEGQSIELLSRAYSPRGVLASAAFELLLVLAVGGVACRRFRNAMPLAGSCSAAISALARLPPEEWKARDEAVTAKLQWGVTKTEYSEGAFAQHCAFSSAGVCAWDPDVESP